ncbi:hypothetical protein ABZ391_34605, partial [Kitasatospora cineracea]
MTPQLRAAARPFSAAALTDLVPAGTRLLALGEPTHGAEEFLDLRNELFRHLVTAHGYRSIAVVDIELGAGFGRTTITVPRDAAVDL